MLFNKSLKLSVVTDTPPIDYVAFFSGQNFVIVSNDPHFLGIDHYDRTVMQFDFIKTTPHAQ